MQVLTSCQVLVLTQAELTKLQANANIRRFILKHNVSITGGKTLVICPAVDFIARVTIVSAFHVNPDNLSPTTIQEAGFASLAEAKANVITATPSTTDASMFTVLQWTPGWAAE